MGLYDNLFFKIGNFIRAETVLGMLMDGYLVDARAGGLVIGKSHEASDKCKARLEVINRDIRPVKKPVVPNIYHRATRVINASATPDDKILLIDAQGQFIVNAVSTKRYFQELQALNDEYAFKSNFCMNDFFIRKP
ncbi:hypothetical protein [Saezia sanguinis]|uniref:hypothetical protein n=1 Tax=Saezia sanguinis TaxID=1965230 RepID=UPI0030544D13